MCSALHLDETNTANKRQIIQKLNDFLQTDTFLIEEPFNTPKTSSKTAKSVGALNTVCETDDVYSELTDGTDILATTHVKRNVLSQNVSRGKQQNPPKVKVADSSEMSNLLEQLRAAKEQTEKAKAASIASEHQVGVVKRRYDIQIKALRMQTEKAKAKAQKKAVKEPNVERQEVPIDVAPERWEPICFLYILYNVTFLVPASCISQFQSFPVKAKKERQERQKRRL